MTTATPAIELVDLRKVFKAPTRRRHDVVAVDGVSFTLQQGGSLGIIGESGSGKTTLARMIVGLEKPTSGVVSVFGLERPYGHLSWRERAAWGRRVQLVFQNPYASLDPRQTVRACLDEVLTLHTASSRQQRAKRVAELMDQTGLDPGVGTARPRELSGGGRQRVAIARALAAEPQVLILDEAVSSLDVSIQAQILNLISDIRAATHISCLCISHDLAVIRQITDDALVMQYGEVVEAGETQELLDFPKHPYTQRLRASVPQPNWKPIGASEVTVEDSQASELEV